MKPYGIWVVRNRHIDEINEISWGFFRLFSSFSSQSTLVSSIRIQAWIFIKCKFPTFFFSFQFKLGWVKSTQCFNVEAIELRVCVRLWPKLYTRNTFFIVNFYRLNRQWCKMKSLFIEMTLTECIVAMNWRQQSLAQNLFLLPWFKPILCLKLRAIISYWYWFLTWYHLVMCFSFQLKRRLLEIEMDVYVCFYMWTMK